MTLNKAALAQGSAIIVAGYLLWIVVPTALGNTFGPRLVSAALPVIQLFGIVVPVVAGARAARVAGRSKVLHGVVSGVLGVAVILMGIFLVFGGGINASYLAWLVGGGMLAWLGVIIEPYVFRSSL